MARSRSQRGSLVEAIPVVLLGILVIFGALQVALFMSGKHAADLAAYRASRVLEARADRAGDAQGAARREAQTTCGIGYPESLTSTSVSASAGEHVELKLRMEPLLPLPFFRPDTFGRSSSTR